MISCEHFIYTGASLKEKTGYQVTAKSSGVSEDIVKDLLHYIYPSDLSEFKESCSLFLLNDSNIAYCRVRNIGIGYDGRPDTLYSHTILINTDDFKKLNYDSRIFNEYYIENPSLFGNLEKLVIEPKEIPINFRLINKYSLILNKIITSIFNKQPIALLLKNETELIQEILAIIPPSLRFISFSTLLDDPQKQSKFEFIITHKKFRRLLQDRFKIIDLRYTHTDRSDSKKPKSLFEESIAYLVGLAYFEDIDKLRQISDNFERIKDSDFKNKLILVTNCLEFSYVSDEKLKQKYADNILEIIKEFDRDTKYEYFNKVKNYSKRYELIANRIQDMGEPSMTIAEAFMLFPAKFMLDLYKAFFDYEKKNDIDD